VSTRRAVGVCQSPAEAGCDVGPGQSPERAGGGRSERVEGVHGLRV